MMKRVLLGVLVLTSVACNKDQATDTKSDPVVAPAEIATAAAPPAAAAAADKKGTPGAGIAMPSGKLSITADGKGNKVVTDNKGNSAAVDDKGASAVTGAAGTKFTDSTGRTVVVGKDGKITVPGVTQDPPAP
jgi:hypothetical protein